MLSVSLSYRFGFRFKTFFFVYQHILLLSKYRPGSGILTSFFLPLFGCLRPSSRLTPTFFCVRTRSADGPKIYARPTGRYLGRSELHIILETPQLNSGPTEEKKTKYKRRNDSGPQGCLATQWPQYLIPSQPIYISTFSAPGSHSQR